MRKLMMLWAMLAMVLVVVVPAAAQGQGQYEVASQEFEQEDVESGDVEPVIDITSAGDNVNFCIGLLQAANAGNVLNEQGVSQYAGTTDDIEFEGGNIEISPELAQQCEQAIEQAAAAGAAPKAAPPAPTPAPTPAPAPAPAAQAGGGGGAAGAAGIKVLPATGGIAPLLAVGAGAALLIGGALLVRRVIR